MRTLLRCVHLKQTTKSLKTVVGVQLMSNCTFSWNDKVIVLTVTSVPPIPIQDPVSLHSGNKLIQCSANRFSFVYICSWIFTNASVIMDDSMFLLVIKGGCYLLHCACNKTSYFIAAKIWCETEGTKRITLRPQER